MLVKSGKRFVAFFDLLGFKSWIKSDGSFKVFTYVRGFFNLVIKASLPGSVVNSDMSVTLKDSDIGFINFSDSIVLYTLDDSDNCLEKIILVSGDLMNGVITGTSRLIRGGISHGDFFADPECNAYVGQALVDAFHLEGAQEWFSCSLDDSVMNQPHFENLLLKYPNFIVCALVPLKKSAKVPYCINWADKEHFHDISFDAERSLVVCKQHSLESLKEDKEELEKFIRRMNNTEKFLRHYNSALN